MTEDVTMERLTQIEEMIHLWDKVLDNSKYLGVEHRYKEKEYGIKWRAAFKEILEKETVKLVKKYGNPLKSEQNGGNDPEPLEVIFAIVEKDYRDMETFRYGKQWELIELLKENLDAYNKTCTYLRSILKDPELHNKLEEQKQIEKGRGKN